VAYLDLSLERLSRISQLNIIFGFKLKRFSGMKNTDFYFSYQPNQIVLIFPELTSRLLWFRQRNGIL